jgi:hypothetical protein
MNQVHLPNIPVILHKHYYSLGLFSSTYTAQIVGSIDKFDIGAIQKEILVLHDLENPWFGNS